MQSIHIFRAGRHTSAGGTTLDFTEDMLRAAAAAYDPAVHEAPIVIGHPQDNAPAYGWVSKLEASDRGLHAVPSQVDAAFAELVKAGRYKKVSASFYLPDAPANPKPGAYYLRHVGFLGAQPPAVKGLKQAEFGGDDAAHVIEFAGEWESASFFRRFREWFIDKFSREEADEVIPAHLVESMEDIARSPAKATESAAPGFSEPTPPVKPEEGSSMTEAEIAALVQRVESAEQRVQQLEAKEQNFAEREQRIQVAERTERTRQIAAGVEKLVAAGKVLPAQKAELIAFLEALPIEQTIAFGEGAAKKTAPEFLLAVLEKGAAQVAFGEHARNDETTGEATITDPTETARKVRQYRAKRRAEGEDVSYQEAVRAVATGAAN